MSASYLISDLHLCPERPDITAALETFLQQHLVDASALYILGDLFESWIGDDDNTPFNRHIAFLFQQVKQQGIALFFIAGNRDFLLGPRYARQAGFRLLPEQYVVTLAGQPCLLLHGDELCTDDKAYQAFRRKARGWWWPRLMQAMPLWYRRRIAARARQRSRAYQSQQPDYILDVNPRAVHDTMRQHGVSCMIHGHTHRPAHHQFILDGQPAQRLVLGAWHKQGSYIKASPGGLELVFFPL